MFEPLPFCVGTFILFIMFTVVGTETLVLNGLVIGLYKTGVLLVPYYADLRELSVHHFNAAIARSVININNLKLYAMSLFEYRFQAVS